MESYYFLFAYATYRTVYGYKVTVNMAVIFVDTLDVLTKMDVA